MMDKGRIEGAERLDAIVKEKAQLSRCYSLLDGKKKNFLSFLTLEIYIINMI